MKKKTTQILIAFSIGIFCVCTPRDNKKVQFEIGNIQMNQSDSVQMEVAETLFPRYKDSMNNFKSGMQLPMFLYNYFLDYEYPWVTDHFVWSLRKKLFDSTNNIYILNEIINSNDIRLVNTVNPDTIANKKLLQSIPYSKESNHQLAIERLKELRHQ